MITSSISSGRRSALRVASRTTRAPSSVAWKVLRVPRNLPTGVLQALTMTAFLTNGLPHEEPEVYQQSRAPSSRNTEPPAHRLTFSKRQNCKDFFTDRVLDWAGVIQYIDSVSAA